jgi:hypothetical protein
MEGENNFGNFGANLECREIDEVPDFPKLQNNIGAVAPIFPEIIFWLEGTSGPVSQRV